MNSVQLYTEGIKLWPPIFSDGKNSVLLMNVDPKDIEIIEVDCHTLINIG